MELLSCHKGREKLYCFTVTHKWVHTLHHEVKLLTHLMSDYKDWREGKEAKAELKPAKETIIEALKPGSGRIGVPYDWPDSRG